MKFINFLTLLLILTACSNKPDFIQHKKENKPLRNNTVFVVGHGWHTGFVIPASKANIRLPFLKKRFKNTAYYEFGWGDKGFYQANEITTGLSIQALFWPTETVMHVVALKKDPLKYFKSSRIVKFKLSDSELFSLIHFIKNSFFHNKSGNVFSLTKGLYGNSQFYKGEGDYYLMNTCNKWTAKGLKSSGFNISTFFKFTESSIIDFLKENLSERNSAG